MNTYTHIKTLFHQEQKRYTIQSETYLYEEGENANDIFYIEKGNLIKLKKDEEQQQVLLGFVRTTQVLGLKTLSKTTHSHSLKALNKSIVCSISKHLIEELLQTDMMFKLTMMQEICKEIGHVENKAHKIHQKNMKQRIAVILLEMFKTYGTGKNDIVNLQYPFRELVKLMGVPPKKLDKTLGELQADGWIQEKGNQVKILDLPAIQHMSEIR